jgi:hypothetical protein
MDYLMKTNHTFHKFIALLLFLLISSIAEGAKRIENLIDVPVPTSLDGTYPSLDEVKRAIISGCKIKGWSPELIDQNKFKATIWVRDKHFAEIEIPFTEDKYSIIYLSSKNLDYNAKKQKIHRNYNKWVILLSEAIKNELRVTH